MRQKIIKNIIWIIFFVFLLVVILLPKKENKFLESSNYIINPRLITSDETLRIAVTERNDNLNMFSDGEADVSLLSKLVNPSLFYKGRNNNVEQYIAKDYWYEDAGKTIAIILNDEYSFSEDEKLTTEHVLNTYKVLSDPGYQGNENSFLENLQGFYKYKINLSQDLEGVEVIDETYIKFHFTNASFSNIYALMYPILNISSDDYKYNQLGNIDKRKLLNGAGRYKITDYDDKSVRLELKNEIKNEGININKIEILDLSYIDAERELKAGNVDIMYKFPKKENFDDQNIGRISEYSYNIDNQSHIYNLIGFHQNSILFRHENYRRALRNTINIEEITEIAFGKGVYDFPNIPVYRNSWFNQQKLEFSDDTNLRLELSKDYQKEGDFFVDENQNEIVIKLVFLENDKFSNGILKNLVENIESQGLRVEILPLTTTDMYRALKGEIEYDVFISQRKMTEIPNYKYEEDYTKEQGYTITNLMDEGFLYLLEKIKEDTNDPEITEMKENWKQTFIKTTPYIVLATENMTTVINNRIQGLYFNEFVGLESTENLKNIVFVE